MIYFFRSTTLLTLALSLSVSLVAQPSAPAITTETQTVTTTPTTPQKVVVVTGARFSYKLVEKWIDEYNKVNPNVQIIVESRGSNDPLKYDILAEVYEQEEALKKSREYINVGRYAVLPVATAGSEFANTYAEKGLNNELIKQIFFHDIFADQEKKKSIKGQYTVYTRLQKAGVPTVFAKHFGFQQKDIKGNGIAGADAHLLKAVLRDSTGVTYLPLPLIYDNQTRKPVEGLTVLPVDLNGNGKVADDEKFYANADQVIEKLEGAETGSLKNIPVEYLHLSVDKEKASPEAVDFLKWVNENGQADLHQYGYLKPESKRYDQGKFTEFASKRGR